MNKSLDDMEKKEQTKVRFVTLFGGPEAKRKSMEEEKKEYNEMFAPLFRLSERLGIETRFFTWETGLDRKTLALLRKRAQDWVENEIAPQFSSDPELLDLYKEFYSFIQWDRFAAECNDLILENKTGEEFLRKVKTHLNGWGWFAWTWENDIRGKLKARGVDDFGERERLCTLAYRERKTYKSIDDILDAILSPAQGNTSAITIHQPNAVVVPDMFRGVFRDNLFFNTLLHGDELDEVKEGDKTREDGTKLKGFNLITQRNSSPVPRRDKLLLFATKSIADRNKVMINGKEEGVFTYSDVVSQLQPKKNKSSTFNKESALYKEVEAGIQRLRTIEVAISSKDYAKNRRFEDVPEDGVVAQLAPLLVAYPAILKRRGRPVMGFVWKDSEPLRMLEKDLDWRFSDRVPRELFPPRLNAESLDLIALMMERSFNPLPTINETPLYKAGNETKDTLFDLLGWLDVSTIRRTLTKEERSKDQAQRKTVEAMLQNFEKARIPLDDEAEGKGEQTFMRFAVTRRFDEKRKLIGYFMKREFEREKLEIEGQ